MRVKYSPELKAAFLSVDKPSITDAIVTQAIAEGFQIKTEFHVTVSPPPYGNALPESMLPMYQSLLEAAEIDDVTYGNEVFYLNHPKIVDGVSYPRESLIVAAYSPQLTELIEKIGKICGVSRQPFLHTTLFTRQDNKHARTGIGIYSPAEFQSMTHSSYSVEK